MDQIIGEEVLQPDTRDCCPQEGLDFDSFVFDKVQHWGKYSSPILMCIADTDIGRTNKTLSPHT